MVEILNSQQNPLQPLLCDKCTWTLSVKYVGQYAYDTGKGVTPHSADVAAAFGVMPNVPAHGKGKDFEGITALVQGVYAAFARSGDPRTLADGGGGGGSGGGERESGGGAGGGVPFEPFLAADPKMTLLDSPLSGMGCKVMETPRVRDAIYRTLVEAIRAAEK